MYYLCLAGETALAPPPTGPAWLGWGEFMYDSVLWVHRTQVCPESLSSKGMASIKHIILPSIMLMLHHIARAACKTFHRVEGSTKASYANDGPLRRSQCASDRLAELSLILSAMQRKEVGGAYEPSSKFNYHSAVRDLVRQPNGRKTVLILDKECRSKMLDWGAKVSSTCESLDYPT